jgi:bifunctional DNase/RNase
MITQTHSFLISLAVALSVGACASAPAETEPPLTEARPAKAAAPDLDGMETAPDGFQKAEVLHVMMTGQGYAVLLGDESGDRVTPIFVGETNAMSIHLRLERRRYERPLTHDLLDSMLERMDARVVKVHIDGLKTGIFVGTVFVATRTRIMEFDARSSDAIALAVGNDVPIFISNEVVEQAGLSREELERQPVPETPETPSSETL